MAQTFVRHYGVFSPNADGTGTARYFAVLCWQGHPVPEIPRPVATDPHPQTYIVPMDDATSLPHWHRLWAEIVARDDAVTHGMGDPTLLHHAGAVPHPHYAHLRLGGTFTWSADPHPAVSALLHAIATESADAHTARFGGDHL